MSLNIILILLGGYLLLSRRKSALQSPVAGLDLGKLMSNPDILALVFTAYKLTDKTLDTKGKQAVLVELISNPLIMSVLESLTKSFSQTSQNTEGSFFDFATGSTGFQNNGSQSNGYQNNGAETHQNANQGHSQPNGYQNNGAETHQNANQGHSQPNGYQNNGAETHQNANQGHSQPNGYQNNGAGEASSFQTANQTDNQTPNQNQTQANQSANQNQAHANENQAQANQSANQSQA
ncbi:MAG: hypothetical protein PHX51_06105 [Clostridia bacterium]|nr:hypothetical protein [Clostridia bacterium]